MATKLEKLTKDLSDLENKGAALDDELKQYAEKNQEIKTRLGAAVLDGVDADKIGDELTKHSVRFQALIEADKQNRGRIESAKGAIAAEKKAVAGVRLNELVKTSDDLFIEVLKNHYANLVNSKMMLQAESEAAKLSGDNNLVNPSVVFRSRIWWRINQEEFRFLSEFWGVNVAGQPNSELRELMIKAGVSDWSKYAG